MLSIHSVDDHSSNGYHGWQCAANPYGHLSPSHPRQPRCFQVPETLSLWRCFCVIYGQTKMLSSFCHWTNRGVDVYARKGTQSDILKVQEHLKIYSTCMGSGSKNRFRSDCADPELWNETSWGSVLQLEIYWNNLQQYCTLYQVPMDRKDGYRWHALEGLWMGSWVPGTWSKMHPGMPEVHTTPTLPAFNA